MLNHGVVMRTAVTLGATIVAEVIVGWMRVVERLAEKNDDRSMK